MSESALYAFCDSKYRKIIVAIVTSVIGLALLLPLTDEYSDNSDSRAALAEELYQAQEIERNLPEFEEQAAKYVASAKDWEKLTITEESLTGYRDALLETVRNSGCQIRSLEASQPTSRTWLKKDDPLSKEAPPKKVKKTPFKLEKRVLTLLVDGDMVSITKLLEKIGKSEQAVFPHRVKLNSANGRGNTTTLEMNLWLFALTR